MQKVSLRVAFALLLASTPLLFCQSPFDGTWLITPAKSKLDPKPFTVYLSQGWYHCVSCTPPFDVQADGQVHPVTGQQFDSSSVTIVDPQTLSIVSKKDGKTVMEQTVTVSGDGKAATLKGKAFPVNGSDPQEYSVSFKRTGTLPEGVHATSGNWVQTSFTDSENDLLTTFKTNGDELSMTDPTGDSYSAKFDGKDYPFKSAFANGVSLKRIDAHTIEETDKRDGTVVNVAKMTISPNGKTMTVVSTDPRSDRTSTYVATKK